MTPLPSWVRLLAAKGVPLPIAEYQFAPPRRWRADWWFPTDPPVAVEIEGGAWIGGRHTRASGFIADIAKYNAMTIAGARLIRVTPAMVASGEVVSLVLRAMGVEQ